MFILKLIKNQPSEWFEVKESGEITSSRSVNELSECPSIPTDEHLMILLPGEDVLMTGVKLPKMRASERLKAIPFALEEELASDPENLGVVIGDEYSDGITVALFDKNELKNQINEWHAANLYPRCVMPDYLSIAWMPGTWSLVVHHNMVLVRTDYQRGFSIDSDNLFLFLQLSLDKKDAVKPTLIACWLQDNVVSETELKKLPVPVELRDVSTHPLFDSKALSHPPINLLTGKTRHKMPSSQLRTNWMICGAAALALIAVMFFGKVGEWIYFSHQTTVLQKQVDVAYRDIIPGSGAILEPRFRVGNLLKAYQNASKGNAFFRLLGQAGQAVMRFPSVTLESIQFQNTQLQLTLQASNMTILNQCLDALRSQGLDVQQHITKTSQNDVQADMIITEK